MDGLDAIVTKRGDDPNMKRILHGLRHCTITAALDASKGDLRSVQQLSRHKSLDTLKL